MPPRTTQQAAQPVSTSTTGRGANGKRARQPVDDAAHDGEFTQPKKANRGRKKQQDNMDITIASSAPVTLQALPQSQPYFWKDDLHEQLPLAMTDQLPAASSNAAVTCMPSSSSLSTHVQYTLHNQNYSWSSRRARICTPQPLRS